MDTRFLGHTGLKVSELCLGTMTFGDSADQAASFEMIEAFIENGGNFIDTANVYNDGLSEEYLGRWLKDKNREDYIIATKVRFDTGDGPNETGLSRKHILGAIEASLRRLKTDYIDLYQVHCWDDKTPLEETLSTLDRLVEAGKVRYIGVSNYKAYQIQKAIDISKANGWEAFVSLQPLYNLLDRSIEWEILELAEAEGLGVIPWSPLRGGWLTGRYRRGMAAPPEGTRVYEAEKHGWSESWSRYNNERTWQIIDSLLAVAERNGKHPAQIALNWLKDKRGVTAPIIGARSMDQMSINLGSTGWSLSAEDRALLDKNSDLPGPYPYDFVEAYSHRE